MPRQVQKGTAGTKTEVGNFPGRCSCCGENSAALVFVVPARVGIDEFAHQKLDRIGVDAAVAAVAVAAWCSLVVVGRH